MLIFGVSFSATGTKRWKEGRVVERIWTNKLENKRSKERRKKDQNHQEQ